MNPLGLKRLLILSSRDYKTRKLKNFFDENVIDNSFDENFFDDFVDNFFDNKVFEFI